MSPDNVRSIVIGWAGMVITLIPILSLLITKLFGLATEIRDHTEQLMHLQNTMKGGDSENVTTTHALGTDDTNHPNNH